MYGCNKDNPEPPWLMVTSKQFPDNVWEMRMSLLCRYDKRQTDAGCIGCNREWDVEYLRERGLLRSPARTMG